MLNEFISTKLLLKLKQIHIIVLKFVDISATEYSIQCDFLERPHTDWFFQQQTDQQTDWRTGQKPAHLSCTIFLCLCDFWLVYITDICSLNFLSHLVCSARGQTHRQTDFESAEYKTKTSLVCLTKVKQSREWFWFLRKGTIDSVGHFNQFPKPSLIVMTNICSQTTLSPCFVQHVHADPQVSPA